MDNHDKLINLKFKHYPNLIKKNIKINTNRINTSNTPLNIKKIKQLIITSKINYIMLRKKL